MSIVRPPSRSPSAEQTASMRRLPPSPKKQLRRWEGAGLGSEPNSDGAFPWQWAAPQLNSPPLFMLFGKEAGFPPRDRWPFSHKVLCLDLACSGARQQSSDDTAFGKQPPPLRCGSGGRRKCGEPADPPNERATRRGEKPLGFGQNLPVEKEWGGCQTRDTRDNGGA